MFGGALGMRERAVIASLLSLLTVAVVATAASAYEKTASCISVPNISKNVATNWTEPTASSSKPTNVRYAPAGGVSRWDAVLFDQNGTRYASKSFAGSQSSGSFPGVAVAKSLNPYTRYTMYGSNGGSPCVVRVSD
jgi:hypothetical protein